MIYWDIVYFVHPDEFFRAPSLLNGSSEDLFGLASVGVMSHSSCGVSVVLATLFWFYTILSAKELFLMNTFHRLMHSHPFWYSWHRTHHTIGRNSCFQLAYRTDIINLFIEDAAAPMVVWVFLWLIGCGEVRIPIYSLHLLALFDGGIHSINPFTVLFWNPIADLYMNANIVHGLHHNRKNTHLTTVPLYHLFDATARTRDETEYDRVMKTTLFKRTGSTELERVGICDQ
jgi:sterol desaturase/sphingolipid hydroxylase (fatty acid hydroxylase superfamily)